MSNCDTNEDNPAAGLTASPLDVIATRLRIGSLLLAGIATLNAILDFTTRPGGLLPVAWIYWALLALVLLVQIAARDPGIRTHMMPFTAVVVILCNAIFCSYAALSPGEIHALAAPSIVLITAAALLFPWGPRSQAIVSVVCVLTYLGALAVSGRVADLAALYALAGVLGAAAVSSVGAHLVDHHRRTAEQRADELREANRRLRQRGIKRDEFLAGVAHELRTPLNVVLGYVELLLENSYGRLEPAQRDILHRITSSAGSLTHLIDDLNDLSRIEAGRMKVYVGAVALPPLFDELRGVMQLLLAGHDVEFTAEIDPGCTEVSADPDRLKQIVSNLLVNAAKFTERGSIALKAEPCADGLVAVSVTDTGIGIPAAAHRAIFEPFRQVHDRGKRVPGAGIGLSISSRLAHLMGGSLGVESEPGQGSRFTLVLPAAKLSTADRGPTQEALHEVS